MLVLRFRVVFLSDERVRIGVFVLLLLPARVVTGVTEETHVGNPGGGGPAYAGGIGPSSGSGPTTST